MYTDIHEFFGCSVNECVFDHSLFCDQWTYTLFYTQKRLTSVYISARRYKQIHINIRSFYKTKNKKSLFRVL